MEQMFVITLREGIEAFLIVAITIACLRKSGRTGLLPAVWWGTTAGILLSAVLGTALSELAVQPLWEGALALAAAAMVISMVVYMLRHAKALRTEIGRRVDHSLARHGAAASAGIFAFVLLMIAREGMEMALITAALARQGDAGDMLAGALLGTGAAALLAVAWSRYGHRINLGLFFQVTSLFLLLFSLQLAVYGFHELTEAGVLPVDNEYWHIATEPYGPEGLYGHWLSYGLVLLPAAWLLIAALRGHARTGTG